jgi:hypothetical protein
MLLTGSGCLEEEKPQAVAVVVDRTLSAQAGRESWLQQLHALLTGGYVKGDIALIELTSEPRLVWAGPSGKIAEIEKALKSLSSGTSEAGSDPMAACQIAEAWLSQPEFKKRRRLLNCWSDLIADAAREEGVAVRRFRDPLREHRWTKSAPLELHLFGVPVQQMDRLVVWHQPPKVTTCAHQPREEALTARHLGLHRELF